MNPEDNFRENTDTKASASRGTLIFFCVILAIGLGGVVTPLVILRESKASPTTAAMSNARQIGIVLYLFEQDYGSFPSPKTAKMLRSKGLVIPPSTSSNAFFSQLIHSGLSTSEDLFHAYNGYPEINQRCDGVITPPSEVLKPGEVGFAYITRVNNVPLSSSDDGFTPLVIDAYQPGTSRFNPDLRNGKVVYLRLDQSVQLKRLDSQGSIPAPLANKTKTFLFAKTNPLWKTGLPVLHQPLPRN